MDRASWKGSKPHSYGDNFSLLGFFGDKPNDNIIAPTEKIRAIIINNKIVDKLIIGIADNDNKKTLLTIDERKKIIENDIKITLSNLHIYIKYNKYKKNELFNILKTI